MRTKTQAEISIALQNPAIQIETVSAIAEVSARDVSRILNTFKRNSYLAFVSSHLNTAVTALASKGKLAVIQVGANDGKEMDPVNKLFHAYAHKALLIEPIPELIDKLKYSYMKYTGDIVIENIAVGPSEGVFSLYRLKSEMWQRYIDAVGRHPTAISSFDKNYLIKKISDRLKVDIVTADSYIECLTCPMLPLTTLIKKHNFDMVDVLQIDCEGFDFIVIESLGDFRPNIINFESFNLSPVDWSKWKAWAKRNNYGYIQGPTDTLAILGANMSYEY